MSHSSAEAEYMAMTHKTCEMMLLKTLLWELGFSWDNLLPMYCDNQAAIFICSNPVFQERTKHRGRLPFCS